MGSNKWMNLSIISTLKTRVDRFIQSTNFPVITAGFGGRVDCLSREASRAVRNAAEMSAT